MRLEVFKDVNVGVHTDRVVVSIPIPVCGMNLEEVPFWVVRSGSICETERFFRFGVSKGSNHLCAVPVEGVNEV